MPRAGETIENPATGETLTFVVTAADSGGTLLQVDVVMQPGRPGPPDHVHRTIVERHDVREGRLAITMDGAERVLEAPASIEIPRGTPHTFRVVGDGPVRTVVDYTPPGRYEDFIAALYALARAGKTDDKGAPRNILQTAVIARPHLDEFALAKPPYAVQRILFAVLAPVGRLAGFRADPSSSATSRG